MTEMKGCSYSQFLKSGAHPINVQVSNNGYFSFEDEPFFTPNRIPRSRYGHIVAPYAADVDTTYGGTVLFCDFDAYTSSGAAMTYNVNDFIRSQTGDSFSGTRIMVAEWREVPQWNQTTVSTFVQSAT